MSTATDFKNIHPVLPPHVQHLNSSPAITQTISDSNLPDKSKGKDKDPDHISNKSMPVDPSDGDSEKYKQRQVDDLFAALKNKLSDKYRFIEFVPKAKKDTSAYKKVVSFDDIDIHYDDDGLPDPDDDFGWELYKMRNRGREGNMPGYGRDGLFRSRSPMASHLSPSPVRNRLDLDSRLDLMQMENNLVQYPTTPITNKKGCTLRKRHKLFDSLSQNRLTIRPMFRTILVYISARIHTWVALDWILSKFIVNGDHVIIVAAVDPRLVEYASNSKRGRNSVVSPSVSPVRGRSKGPLSPKRYPTEDTPFGRLVERSKPPNIVKIADDLMKYAMEVINPDIIAKLTVEIVQGETKEVLKDMYKLYEPNLVCTGSKPNTKVAAPLRSWQSSKLTDRLIKNFPLPVIVVPAMNMYEFEEKLQGIINHSQESPTKQVNEINETDEESEVSEEEEEEDEESEDEDEVRSINSGISEASYDSYYEVGHQFVDYKQTVEKGLDKLKVAPLNQDYYSNMAQFISDESLKFCSEIIDIQPRFTGHGANLARAITGSNSFGKASYKSMLDTSDNDSSQNKMSFKDVKEQLRLNKIRTQQESNSTSASEFPQPPTIDVSSPTPSPSPSPSPTREPSLLKFVNLEKPSTTNNEKKQLRQHNSPLRKCFSHSEEALNTSKLEPRKSHPGKLENSRDDSDKKRSKKKKFWLF